MFEFFEALAAFAGRLWQTILLALQLDPALYQTVENSPQSTYLIFAVVMLAGASQLLGQSVALFVNRVSPSRFVASLILNGILFAVSLVIWAITIWLIGTFIFASETSLGKVIRIVCLGSAPLVFGFLILIPYLGTFISRVLSVWSFLIVLRGVGFSFQIGVIGSLICVGLGWLLILFLSDTIGRPVIFLRDRIWRRITGSSLEVTAHDMLAAIINDTAKTSRQEPVQSSDLTAQEVNGSPSQRPARKP
ncbi:MAG: hypothetical protein MI924_02240 [Chloroflexales bacterium]|nr:hypothetical protein [Chloroflexales bacterium]